METDISKQPLVIINGPTAVGKTAAAVELAKLLDGEIISADSMQVYRGMDIGTAKVTREEMQGIRHHLIDIIDPDEPFSVLEFKRLAEEAIKDIASRGKLPIIAGGTGYYIQAVLYDVDFTEYSDDEQSAIRSKLEEQLKNCGALYMHEYLRSFDPDSAEAIHPNNTKRLLHAIEFYELTGKTISEHNREQSANESPYDFMYFVITDDRESIYDRINRRVDAMLENGLEKEVRKLLDAGYTEEMQSMLGIGYKETVDCILGRVSRDEAAENIKKETRHYAKKQLTWFKREKCVEFIDRRNFNGSKDIALYLSERIKNHFESRIDNGN